MDIRRWLLDDIETHRLQFALTSGMVPTTRWHERPRAGDNSVAFLVWHIARWQDISLNVTVRNATQVFAEGWAERLGVGADPGTGFTDAQVDDLSCRVDPVALDEYRSAVQDSTVAWLESIDDGELDRLLTMPIDQTLAGTHTPNSFPRGRRGSGNSVVVPTALGRCGGR